MKRVFTWITAIVFVILCVSALAEDASYRVSLKKGTPIYKGPGEEYGFAQNVRVDGVYTIVKEAVSEDCYLWGRLKSGAGWVRLSDEPVTAMRNVPYTIKIPAWVSIFHGPGCDFGYKQLVGTDGAYTIVEERIDEEGKIWGRLKFGVGWVDLTNMERAKTLPAIISFADDSLLESGEFISRKADASEYSVKIAVRANELLRNVRFTSLTLGEEFWETEKVLYSARYMQSWRPLVIEVTFWGDMTTFGFDFTDESGVSRRYLMNISGRSGELYVWEAEG